MNYNYKSLLLILVFFGSTAVYAQSDINTAGADATGSNGSASYTIGQLNYATYFGTNGSASLGVQQPYEISVVVGVDELFGINLGLNVFPNPTVDFLSLEVDDYLDNNLTFYLYDLNGKILAEGSITQNVTTIQMSTYEPAIYFVKISQNQKDIKTFKIAKN